MTSANTAPATKTREDSGCEDAPVSAEALAREEAEDRADNLADDLTEARTKLAAAEALIDGDELHETCDADLEAAKAQTRIARQQLACALVITAIAVLVALLK